MPYTLVIANKRYSSWSLRPWLLMKMAGIQFLEEQIFLKKPDTEEKISRFSPGGRVPVLLDGNLKIWESLSICEYLAEKHPEKNLWPKKAEARAVARSISNEIHAGFMALRSNCPMNCASEVPGFKPSNEVMQDITRISEIWNETKTQYGKSGKFLFGEFSIADAMYAPVVTRFKTYGIKTDSISEDYMKTILSLGPMQEWVSAATKETERISAYEINV